MSRTLTIPELAEMVGVSRNSMYAEAKTGEVLGIPVLRVGRRLLVPRAPVERLLTEGTRLTGDETGSQPTTERIPDNV